MQLVLPSTFRRLLASIALAATLVHAPARADDAAHSQTTAMADGVVNLNTAEEAELVRLPGVGPAKARAILDLRARMKGFKRIEDLMRVKGIGRKTFRKLAPLLTLEGPTTLANKASQRAPKEAEPAEPSE